MKARAQRASAQGIGEGDLPPVPRGIMEPPPLPPPEAHVRDTRKGKRAAAKARHRKGKAGARKGKVTASRPKVPTNRKTK